MKIKPHIETLLVFLSGISIEILISYTNIFQTYYITYIVAGIVYSVMGSQFQKHQAPITNIFVFLIPLVLFKIFLVEANSYNYPFIFPFCFTISLFSFIGGYFLSIISKSFLLFLLMNSFLIYFLGFIKSPQLVFERQRNNKNKYNTLQVNDWNLLKLDGSRFSFAEIKDKVILLNFSWKNCGQCIQKQPYLEQVTQKYKNNSKFILIEVYLGEYDSIEVAHAFSKKYGTGLTWAYDSNNELAKKLNYSGAPHEVLVDNNGKVRNVYVGFNGDLGILYIEKISEKIDELLK